MLFLQTFVYSGIIPFSPNIVHLQYVLVLFNYIEIRNPNDLRFFFNLFFPAVQFRNNMIFRES